MNYEAVIGLEVHVQLATASKMFTRVAAGYGEPANTLTDPVVLALPGALPVLNKAALDQIIKAGLILGCSIAPVCKWDRKNYFYPDSPKNYQLSQYDQPICLGDAVEIELPGPARNVLGEHKKIPLTRIHLEEDVGKLTHGAQDTLVDYNRAGTPLMEIVSEPALASAEEAYAFLTSLRLALVHGGISDCDMEKGQMRCDANISIRPVGTTRLGTKVELKNLNSISFVRDGIAHEIRRQLAVAGHVYAGLPVRADGLELGDDLFGVVGVALGERRSVGVGQQHGNLAGHGGIVGRGRVPDYPICARGARGFHRPAPTGARVAHR